MAQLSGVTENIVIFYKPNYIVILEKQILLIYIKKHKSSIHSHNSLSQIIKHTTSRLEIVTENNINLIFTHIYT